jgi:hypothetical protein
MTKRDTGKAESRKEGSTFASRCRVPCPLSSHLRLSPDARSASADTKGAHPYKGSFQQQLSVDGLKVGFYLLVRTFLSESACRKVQLWPAQGRDEQGSKRWKWLAAVSIILHHHHGKQHEQKPKSKRVPQDLLCSSHSFADRLEIVEESFLHWLRL